MRVANSKNPEAIEPLESVLHDPEPLIRSHAAWALGQLESHSALKQHLEREKEAQVRSEILIALGEQAAPHLES